MIDDITVLILTLNEAPNIARTLEALRWAKDIVVVDSFSADETPQIARSFSNVRFFQNAFKDHAAQWNFALHETQVKTEWVLALDADYWVPADFVEELRRLAPPIDVVGYQARFKYQILGRRLRQSLYPDVVVLFRRKSASYRQDGHTQRVQLHGRVEKLNPFIVHDDRKKFVHWRMSQEKYIKLEVQKILDTEFRDLSLQDRIRKTRLLGPPAVLIYCLLFKGLLFDGWPGVYYSFQRLFAESLLSLRLFEQAFKHRNVNEK